MGQNTTTRFLLPFWQNCCIQLVHVDVPKRKDNLVKGEYEIEIQESKTKVKELPWEEWEKFNQLLEEAGEYRRGLWKKEYYIPKLL